MVKSFHTQFLKQSMVEASEALHKVEGMKTTTTSFHKKSWNSKVETTWICLIGWPQTAFVSCETQKGWKFEVINFSLHEFLNNNTKENWDFHLNTMTFLKEHFIKSIHISNQSQSAMLRLFIFSSVHQFSQDAGKVLHSKYYIHYALAHEMGFGVQ